jgi:hypothetical protein
MPTPKRFRHPQTHRRRRLRAAILVALAAAVLAVPAAAAPIPGATYHGKASDGAILTFTVSADGSDVSYYQLLDVIAGACRLTAEGDAGVWSGAPISGNSFTYQLGDLQTVNSILFQGTFTGAKSASGTFRLYDVATPQTAACDTGAVTWTATTTASPSGPKTGGGGGGPGPGTATFATRVSFHRVSSKRLGGRLGSSAVACRAGRTITLWRRSRRIATTTSNAKGKFSFDRSTRVRSQRVRVTVTARKVKAGMCAAGSSTFIDG